MSVASEFFSEPLRRYAELEREWEAATRVVVTVQTFGAVLRSADCYSVDGGPLLESCLISSYDAEPDNVFIFRWVVEDCEYEKEFDASSLADVRMTPQRSFLLTDCHGELCELCLYTKQALTPFPPCSPE